jgi:hypothetical protein
MPTPSEVKAVVALLKSADFETPEDGARAVIAKLDALRRDKMRYAVAVQGLPTAYLYGDFENRQEAVNWAKRVALDVSGLSVGVLPLYSRDAVLARHQKMTDEIVKKNTPEPVEKKSRRRKTSTAA